jgi:hypothetical protein
MGVSGQRHAPAALYPRGKNPRYPLDRRLGGWVGPRTGLDAGARRKICPCLGSNLDRQIVQPVVRHYTAWATAVPYVHIFCSTFCSLDEIQWISSGRSENHASLILIQYRIARKHGHVDSRRTPFCLRNLTKQLRGFWKKRHTSKIKLLWKSIKTFPASELVKNFYFVWMHLHVLQLRNIVTGMYMVYVYRNKTKINGRKLFLFEKYSSTGKKRLHHSLFF